MTQVGQNGDNYFRTFIGATVKEFVGLHVLSREIGKVRPVKGLSIYDVRKGRGWHKDDICGHMGSPEVGLAFRCFHGDQISILAIDNYVAYAYGDNSNWLMAVMNVNEFSAVLLVVPGKIQAIILFMCPDISTKVMLGFL